MSKDRSSSNGSGAAWLFPATYALHLVDEYVSGDGFWAWAERTLALPIGRGEFVAWNAFGFV